MQVLAVNGQLLRNQMEPLGFQGGQAIHFGFGQAA
jgi:hypothetical protein